MITIINPQVSKCLDISTLHITQQDSELLTASRGLCVYPYEYGYFVRVPAEEPAQDLLVLGYSSALISILTWASEHDMYFVNIDQDGMPYDELETFDW